MDEIEVVDDIEVKLKRILVVDDVELNRELLADILSDNYEIEQASNGKEVIDRFKDGEQFDLILLDIQMPGINGYNVLDYMVYHKMLVRTPVIIISGDHQSEARCFDYDIADFIAKPFEERIILKRVKNVIEARSYQHYLENEKFKLEKTKIDLENKVELKIMENESQRSDLEKVLARLQKTNDSLIYVIANLVESRSKETGYHVQRVSKFTEILALQVMKDFPEYDLNNERVARISKAAALHDLGKIYIPDAILLKPGKLTAEEFEIMKTHSQLGVDALELSRDVWIWGQSHFETCMEICHYHHERWDGKGYPEQLAGDAIPVSAQMVSIADCYDALVSERCYKKAFTKDVAFEMITTGKCGAFNPKLLRAFSEVRPLFEETADTLKAASTEKDKSE